MGRVLPGAGGLAGGERERATDLSRYDPISGFPSSKPSSAMVRAEDGGKGRHRDWRDRCRRCGWGDGGSPDIPDHNATTPSTTVRQAMVAVLESSPATLKHLPGGKDAKFVIESAEEPRPSPQLHGPADHIHRFLHRSEQHGDRPASAHRGSRREIITTPTEHSAVIEPCRWLELSGSASRSCRLTGLVRSTGPLGADGPETLRLVMMANNETDDPARPGAVRSPIMVRSSTPTRPRRSARCRWYRHLDVDL